MKPVSYLQTDSRWRYNDYSAKGESTTIGASGCGITAMAMVIASLADKNVTPATEAKWALAHGWKCPHSGTYYGYFVPAGKRYNIKVTQLNSANIYGNSTSAYHDRVKAELQKGNWVIACMGKGNWTSSGHYILCYDWHDNIVEINDPASTKYARLHGDWSVFKKQVKYYWVVEVPKTTTTTTTVEQKIKDELNMTKTEFINSLTNEEAYEILRKAEKVIEAKELPAWVSKELDWDAVKASGATDGTRPESYVKRDELMVILKRLGVI